MNRPKITVPTTRSRTGYTVRNGVVGIIFFILLMILQFVSRRVFINYLGASVLGINSTIISLLEFLNLAEMGIATAVGYSLYGPLAKGDQIAVSGILGLHRWLYRRVAVFMIIGALVLMPFFPRIFAKSGLPMWYAYSTFIVMLAGAVTGYLVNYSEVVLTASQRDYKVNISYRGPKVIIISLQIIAIVKYPALGYQLLLILETIGIIVSAILMRYMVGRTFPGLKISEEGSSTLRRKYPNVMKITGLLIYHKIGGFLVKQMTPFMVYLFVTVSTVAVYANYLLIMTGMYRFVESVFKGIEAGIGNLHHTLGNDHEMVLFTELHSVRILMGSILFYAFSICSNPFTAIWVGEEYQFSGLSVILLGLLLYIWIIKGSTESFTLAKGVVADIWAPLCEGLITLIVSISAGYYYGLNGVICGALSGVTVMTFIWKPYYLITRGFRQSNIMILQLYYRPLIISILIAILVALIVKLIGSGIKMELIERNEGTQLIIGIIKTLLFAIIFAILQYLTDKGIRRFYSRIIAHFSKTKPV